MIIYKLTNLINNKVYIGLTTKTLAQRLSQHHYESRHGVNRPLYRAMRKYGENKFSAEIIDSAENLQDLKEKEQYWIKYYNSYGATGNGYNATKGGDMTAHQPVGYTKISLKDGTILEQFEKATDTTNTQNADKITQTQYTDFVLVKTKNILNKTPEQIKDYAFSLRPKVICQLDKNNNLIARWMNSSDVISVYPNITKSCLFACLWGKRKTHLGFKWKYYQDYIKEE